MYSVYALVDPRDQAVRYVGLSQNVHKRYAAHLVISERPNKTLWIKELMQAGTPPALTVLETNLSRKEAEAKEGQWIQHYLDQGYALLNLSKNRKVKPGSAKDKPKVTQGNQEEEALLDLLKSHGWNLLVRKRGERDYFYAQKWMIGEVYISSRENLPGLKPEQIISKIQKIK